MRMICADRVAVLYAGVACPVLSQSDAGGRRFRSGPLMIGTISVDLQLDPRENVRSLRRVPFGARMRDADLVVSRFCTQESEGYPSGQRGQTVNLLAYAFGGSNPPPSTSFTSCRTVSRRWMRTTGSTKLSGTILNATRKRRGPKGGGQDARSNPPPSTSFQCNGALLRQRAPLSRE